MRQRAALAAAQQRLVGVDPVLDAQVHRFGPARLRPPAPVSARFENLARSIAYQQLHGAAAATIWRRTVEALDGDVVPETVLACGPERLRACGLSGSKAASLIDLATRAALGEIPFATVGRMSDDEVIDVLTTVRGIGRWTAQMFLMSSLGRMDVWPTGDLGVRAGYARAWQLPATPTEKEFEPMGDRFVGARSLVAWYCWRVLDTVTP
jgi:3-methyladenine DNA glycosylase/8-oxoguanine DNA glycosylase